QLPASVGELEVVKPTALRRDGVIALANQSPIVGHGDVTGAGGLTDEAAKLHADHPTGRDETLSTHHPDLRSGHSGGKGLVVTECRPTGIHGHQSVVVDRAWSQSTQN